MEAVARGERSAGQVVASRLLGRVRRLCRCLLRSADSDDAAQNALLEVFRSASSFRGESSLERWSDRITVRVALGGARRRRKELGMQDLGTGPEQAPDPRPPLGAAEATIDATVLLECLPPPLSEVLMLHHGLEYTVPEIVELTGLPSGTVRDRLLRGRAELHRLMRREALLRDVKGGSP
jgi:RNA polymerase sigma-70 factor (ECF subfamily)